MAPNIGILALIDDVNVREDVDRVSAAVGIPVVHAPEPSSSKVWAGAAAVLLDVAAAHRCAARALPRRDRIVVVGRGAPGADEWQAALAVGARKVLTLPADESELMDELSEAAEATSDSASRGAVVAVVAGRGGAGASVFAAALAQSASVVGEAMLLDVDPWGGGLDLVLGSEADSGLRWPDLALQGGRLSYSALRDALPRRNGISVLSCGPGGADIEAAALASIIDAGSRGGATVICDVPRRPTAAARTALETADLAVLLAPADVRSCAAASAVAHWLTALNPNGGLVVRGPSPGGLRSSDVREIVGLPLLATMRPQPGLAAALERGGLRVRARTPLAVATRSVLAVLQDHPTARAA